MHLCMISEGSNACMHASTHSCMHMNWLNGVVNGVVKGSSHEAAPLYLWYPNVSKHICRQVCMYSSIYNVRNGAIKGSGNQPASIGRVFHRAALTHICMHIYISIHATWRIQWQRSSGVCTTPSSTAPYTHMYTCVYQNMQRDACIASVHRACTPLSSTDTYIHLYAHIYQHRRHDACIGSVHRACTPRSGTDTL